VPEADWPALAARLVESGDPGVVAGFARPAPAGALAGERERIDDAFDAPDLATLSARLAASDWGHAVLKVLAGLSPLSMATTLALIRAARHEPGVEAALAREYRATWRCIEHGDLLEGIRAAVIEKGHVPAWRYGMDEIRPEHVADMLAPLGADELVLPAAD
jgi:enoyl-CoA hydratase/carnithine racemase